MSVGSTAGYVREVLGIDVTEVQQVKCAMCHLPTRTV